MTRKTYAALRQRALEAAEAKRPVVLDATFGKKHHRDALREALREAPGGTDEEGSVPYCFVELVAPDEAVKERLSAREGTRSLSDARLEDFGQLDARYEPPTALEDARHVTVNTAGDDGPDAATTALLKHLVRLL